MGDDVGDMFGRMYTTTYSIPRVYTKFSVADPGRSDAEERAKRICKRVLAGPFKTRADGYEVYSVYWKEACGWVGVVVGDARTGAFTEIIRYRWCDMLPALHAIFAGMVPDDFWEDITIDTAPKKDETAEKYPHKCKDCGHPAYVGFVQIECSNKACKHGE